MSEGKKSRKQKLIERLTEHHDRISPGCVGDVMLVRSDIKVILVALGAPPASSEKAPK